MPTMECPVCGKIVPRQWIGGTNRPIAHYTKGGTSCTEGDARLPSLGHHVSNDSPRVPHSMSAIRPLVTRGGPTLSTTTDPQTTLALPFSPLGNEASSRIIEPPLADVEAGRLRTTLNPGEKLALDFFHRHLPPAWEIYIQPHLNGLRPDFVLLHPRMRVQWKSATAPDWAALLRAWREVAG